MSEGKPLSRRWLWKLAFRHARLATKSDANMALVLYEFWEWTDHMGLAWPSIESVAGKTGLTEKTAGKYLRRAELYGWLARRLVERPGKPAHYQGLLAFPRSVRVCAWIGDCLLIPDLIQKDFAYVEAWERFNEQEGGRAVLHPRPRQDGRWCWLTYWKELQFSRKDFPVTNKQIAHWMKAET